MSRQSFLHLSLRDRLLCRGVSFLGWFILQFIGKTSRFHIHMAPGARPLVGGPGPYIYAFWHRYQLLNAYVHRGEGATVVVSLSRDGEFIARTMELMGLSAVRGSSSRGGASALLELIRRLGKGKVIAFTPDGPRGPYRSVHPGVLAAARKTGAPVVPIAWSGTRVKVLSSWDRFLVPLPFSVFHVVYGEPVHVGPEDDGEEKIRRALDAAEREAAGYVSAEQRETIFPTELPK